MTTVMVTRGLGVLRSLVARHTQSPGRGGCALLHTTHKTTTTRTRPHQRTFSSSSFASAASSSPLSSSSSSPHPPQASESVLNTAPQPSFFRRPLPQHLISFTSEEGRHVFREALADRYMESFFPLSQQYTTQQEPAFCGLTSLTMCLNALDIDPQRNWKGPWRYFAEELLDCCTPIELVKRRGITFAEFACLAQCNGAAVEMHRADCSSLEEFRSLLLDSTSRLSPNPCMLSSHLFSRSPLRSFL